jgi:hypothetical protein
VGKLLYSSSLLHSNFMTTHQRRLIVMRALEDANRVQVRQWCGRRLLANACKRLVDGCIA